MITAKCKQWRLPSLYNEQTAYSCSRNAYFQQNTGRFPESVRGRASWRREAEETCRTVTGLLPLQPSHRRLSTSCISSGMRHELLPHCKCSPGQQQSLQAYMAVPLHTATGRPRGTSFLSQARQNQPSNNGTEQKVHEKAQWQRH